jgi:hypothetical protein
MKTPDLGITIRNALVDAIYRLQDDPGVDLLELERFCVEAARRDPAVILAAALELPEVKALVEAAKEVDTTVNGNNTARRKLSAALAALKPDAKAAP